MSVQESQQEPGALHPAGAFPFLQSLKSKLVCTCYKNLLHRTMINADRGSPGCYFPTLSFSYARETSGSPGWPHHKGQGCPVVEHRVLPIRNTHIWYALCSALVRPPCSPAPCCWCMVEKRPCRASHGLTGSAVARTQPGEHSEGSSAWPEL